jgi:hypothetical protein
LDLGGVINNVSCTGVHVEAVRVVKVAAEVDNRVVQQLNSVESLVLQRPHHLLDLVDQLNIADAGNAEQVWCA